MPTIHLVHGFVDAGKTTFARRLEGGPMHVPRSGLADDGERPMAILRGKGGLGLEIGVDTMALLIAPHAPSELGQE